MATTEVQPNTAAVPNAATEPIYSGDDRVGYGYWCPNLLNSSVELLGAEVNWVCDARPKDRKKAQTRYPSVPVTTTCDEILSDPAVDAVLTAMQISIRVHGEGVANVTLEVL